MSAFLPAFRRVAFQAPSRFFVCNQCLRQTPRAAPSSRILNAAQSRFFVANATGPVNTLAAEAAEAAAKASAQAKYVFPKTTSRAVGYWLIGSAVSVFGIVVWGGLTRLTESGYVNEAQIQPLFVLTDLNPA